MVLTFVILSYKVLDVCMSLASLAYAPPMYPAVAGL